MRIGLVGLGRMGSAMAARLASFDIHASTWDQSAQACAAAAGRGVAVAANPCEVAQESDLIITTITEDEGVRGLFSMQGGFGEADLDGKLFIEMSTLRPQTVRDLARARGYVASFMPKISESSAGNSLHVRRRPQDLRCEPGRNLRGAGAEGEKDDGGEGDREALHRAGRSGSGSRHTIDFDVNRAPCQLANPLPGLRCDFVRRLRLRRGTVRVVGRDRKRVRRAVGQPRRREPEGNSLHLPGIALG